MTNRGTWGIIVAIAFVAGSIMTGTMAFAAPGGGSGNPFNAIQQQLDALQAQVDSFFDIFTEISVHNADVEDLRSEIASIPAGPPGQDGQDGQDGVDGLNCWDLNGNGIMDPEEDISPPFGVWDASDCRGADGQDGQDGVDGQDGQDGQDGADGTGLGTHEHARAFDGPYVARPCNLVDPSLSAVSHLINPDAAVMTEVDFEEFAIEYPFMAFAQSDPFIGEIVLFSGYFAPQGWAFAEGQLLAISQNQALFAILGTSYGGNGETNFALPDMRCFNGDPGPRWIIALFGVFPSQS